jgi:2-isopropylmalate synthase
MIPSRRLSIFDTTLRDGEQAPGNAMTIDQKVRIARELDDLGVDVIEAGFPAASETDFRAARELSKQVRRAKVCVFARATKEDVSRAFHAVQRAPTFQVEVMTTVSDIHLEHKRGMTRADALEETRVAIAHAAAVGFTDISIGPEDSTRADPEFLNAMVAAAIDSGASTVVLPDTVGGSVPSEFFEMVANVRSAFGYRIRVAVHAHNDLGLATANTLAGIEAGADECQVSLCGIGERAGNAALEEVVAALLCRPDHFKRSFGIKSDRIPGACEILRETISLSLPRNKPVIGENAFVTAAGIHQSGLIKHHTTYEALRPELFGLRRHIAITRHSGRQALQVKMRELGIEVPGDDLQRIYDRIVADETIVIYEDDAIRALCEEMRTTLNYKVG